MEPSWICSSPDQNGSPCQQKLTSKIKFCPECGKIAKPPVVQKNAPELYTWPCQNILESGSVCGKELSSKKKFCGRCGAKVGSPICRHCFELLEEVNTFCDSCGERLRAPANQTPGQPEGATSGAVGSTTPAAAYNAYQYESSDSLSYQDISNTPGVPGSQESSATTGHGTNKGPGRPAAVLPALEGEPGQEFISSRSKPCASPPSEVLPSMYSSLAGEPPSSIESESEYAATTEDSRPQSEEYTTASSDDDTEESTSLTLSLTPTPNETVPKEDGQPRGQTRESEQENGNTSTHEKADDSRGLPPTTKPEEVEMIQDSNQPHGNQSEPTGELRQGDGNSSPPKQAADARGLPPSPTPIEIKPIKYDNQPDQVEELKQEAGNSSSPEQTDDPRGFPQTTTPEGMRSIHDDNQQEQPVLNYNQPQQVTELKREDENRSPTGNPENALSNTGIFSRGSVVDKNGPEKQAPAVFGTRPEPCGKAYEVACGAATNGTYYGRSESHSESTGRPETLEELRAKRMEHLAWKHHAAETTQGCEQLRDTYENSQRMAESTKMIPVVKQEVLRLEQLHGTPAYMPEKTVNVTPHSSEKDQPVGQSTRVREVPPCSIDMDTTDGPPQKACEVQAYCSTRTPDEAMPSSCIQSSTSINTLGDRTSEMSFVESKDDETETGVAMTQAKDSLNNDPAVMMVGPKRQVDKIASGASRQTDTHPLQSDCENPACKLASIPHGAQPKMEREVLTGRCESPSQQGQGPKGEASLTQAKETASKEDHVEVDHPSNACKGNDKPTAKNEATDDQALPTLRLYKKQDEAEVYVNPTNKKKKKGKSHTHEEENTVVIHFHVILDSKFKYDRKEGEVYVVFGDERLGGWNKPIHKLGLVRELEDKSCLFTGDVRIPVTMLRRKISYKYCLIRKEKNEWIWEDTKRYDMNRSLAIKFSEVQQIGFAHQYDGIMLRTSEENVLKKKIKYWTGSEAEEKQALIKMATRAMMPSWDGFCIGWKDASLGDTLTASETIKNIQNLRCCMEDWPVCDGVKDNKEIFKEVLKEYLQPRIQSYKEPSEESRETQEEAALRLASAVCAVILTQYFGIELKIKDNRKIMGALQLRPDEKQQICYDYDALLSCHFPADQKQSLAYYLKTFMQNHFSKANTDVRWFKCVPLLHFLEEKSKPFEVPPVIFSDDHRNELWWGIDGMKNISDRFSKERLSSESLVNILEALVPLYKVDYLLPRTILASLNYKHIETILGYGRMPSDAVLAMVWYHMYVGHIYPVDIKSFPPKLSAVIENFTTNFPETQEFEELRLVTWHIAAQVCLEILDVVIQLATARNTIVFKDTVIQMVFVTSSAIKKKNDILCEKKKFAQRDVNVEHGLTDLVHCWLNAWLPSDIGCTTMHKTVTTTGEVDTWSSLLHVDLHDDGRNAWRTRLLNRLRERLTKVQGDELLSIYDYAVKFDTHHQDLIDVFNEFAFAAAERQMLSGSSFNKIGINSRLWRMFSIIFMKMWPKSNGKLSHDETAVLKHILTMPSLKRFLHLFKNEEASNTVKGQSQFDECRLCLAEAESLLFKVVKELGSGDILISQLKIVLDNPKALVENAEVVQPWCPEAPNSTVLFDIIQKRKEELELLHHYKGKTNELINLCRDFDSVDVSALETKLEKVNMDLKLNAFCEPVRYNSENKAFDKDRPLLTILTFSAEVEKKMMSLLNSKESQVFSKFWMRLGKACEKKSHGTGEKLTVEDIFNVVYPKTENFWEGFIKKVQEGTVPLKTVDFGFQELYPQWDQIEKELMFMFENKEDPRIQERLSQIKRYSTIAQYEHGARVMLEAKNTLGLSGDFSILEQIIEATCEKNAELRSITEDIGQAGRALTGLNDNRIDCIKAFVHCKPLVDWLREHVEKLQELKTLVDLALISAVGQGDWEVTKVSCLHAAVSGFAPLIYDLKQTAGFKEFYRNCENVWHAYDADSNLPKKLVNLSDELEWLKGVKEAQGDVEVNALKQVSAINSRGIYIVGNHSGQLSKNYEDIILVKVPAEEKPKEGKTGKTRVYTLSDLKELQSKLMLVAGKAEKGNEEVDSFVEKFDGVTALAATFVNICTAGNILFKTWTAKFYCDPDKKLNAVVDFGLSEKKLTGQSSNAKVTEQISEVREFMDQCLEQWKRYIEEKRAEFPELNHYTTEQLVILRSKLIVSGDTKLDDKVFALLHDVHPDCTMKDLQTAIREAIKEINANAPSHQIEDKAAAGDEDFTHCGVDSDEMKEYVQTYGPRIVQRAIENCKDDLSQLEYFCMELEEQEQEEGMEVDEDDGEEQPLDLIQGDQTMGNMTAEFMKQLSDTKSTLRETLEKLWSKVFEFSSISARDYLSIDHLGIILKHLAMKDAIDRTLPAYLKPGRPNLIVCPESDILLTVVSVYMETDNLPLPSRNEVLLCNESTSPEEVELLIRRAVSEDSGRIFLLVGAHLLNYEVAGCAERAIEVHTRGKDNYRLAVICSSEQQDRSRLVTALDNHRVHTPVRPPLQRVRTYIQNQLQGRREEPASACGVDPENCCVRVVKSDRAGTGKSLWMKRKGELLKEKTRGLGRGKRCRLISMPLFGRSAQVKMVLDVLLEHTPNYDQYIPSLYHINIPHEMQDGVDHLLFNLVILGSLVDPGGYVWRRNQHDLYVIEILPLLRWETMAIETQDDGRKSVHHVLEFLPSITCRSPKESLEVLLGRDTGPAYKPPFPTWSTNDQLIDVEEFLSVAFQRVYQYLKRLDVNGDLRSVDPHIPEDTPADCLQVLLRFCGLEDPTWAEMVHFVQFLNVQLTACENSCFCTIAATADDTLPGFLKFVVRFMIQMSKDFSTRSLNMAEETQTPFMGVNARQDEPGVEEVEDELVQFQLKRRWETSPHPYIFFNPDQATMTFLGFVVSPPNFDIVDPRTNAVLEEKIMTQQLFEGLRRNSVNLSENFDRLPRHQQIEKLCMVMGNEEPHDPDDKYVLTADNAKKILAIQMRFRCNIPVVIMGETGCGKTYLIKFMCSLQCPPDQTVKNMLLMKVHGGTTEADIIKKVEQGQVLARKNREKFPGMHTVLFLDEVNTTEALGLVKEVLCDHSLNGHPLGVDSGLRLIAACNPYRKHSQEVIEKLEQAGLGYHVTADQTSDKLGRIPMRRLVYRVQPLPQSLLPLVWDFGQLPSEAEMLYIHQIVRKKLAADEFEELPANAAANITNILVAAQTFMRDQQDECSFVSLRDVERAMEVMHWFYTQQDTLFPMMDRKRDDANATHLFGDHDVEDGDDDDEFEDSEDEGIIEAPRALQRSLILALGVCYHACLQEKREEFRDYVNDLFEGTFELANGSKTIEEEISTCQDVFLDEIELGPNIAKNQALKENVFMMVVCIELRIPLFLVGKPGSSKSLAKTIVADAMQGPNSRSPLFKRLKQAYMVSYQCSPLSTPDGIVSIFQQCGQLQKDKGDLDKFVAVVVLDEIGLAEDSPRMPLKALHPLLEDGCEGDDEAEKHKKVGFIGISNWALDPAKMNRGILVQRGSPDADDLEATARDICSTDRVVARKIAPLMRPLAMAYSELYDKAIHSIREFYGLRDFYSLVKMVYGFAKNKKEMPTWRELQHAILRNFGGLESMEPVEVFSKQIAGIVRKQPPKRTDPDITPGGLIHASLCGKTIEGDSRYLLVLTENYAALPILQQNLDAMQNAIIIFGSSFPKDQDYVVVCRNINRIKVCMETGQTVVLLNLESLYESLYDALNQYYTYFGGQRHVDLGLGSHRVKSRVHQDFKLIVVAEKNVVYKKFPIPLINRLEKHFVAQSTMLTKQQQHIVSKLSEWASNMAKIPPNMTMGKTKSIPPTASDIFIGYHRDTCATVVLQVCYQMRRNEGDDDWAAEVLRRSKDILLQCATPEAIVRVCKTPLKDEEEVIMDTYFNRQQHDSLIDYLRVELNRQADNTAFIQVTTHSRLLSNNDVKDIAHAVGLPTEAVNAQTLQAFNTEQQFSNLLREYFTMQSPTDQILLIQCDSADKNAELIACARFIIREQAHQAQQNDDLQTEENHRTKRHIIIIVQLPRVSGGCFVGFQGGMWQAVHLDDLRAQQHQMPSVAALKNQSLSSLVGASFGTHDTPKIPTPVREETDMEIDIDEIVIEDDEMPEAQVQPNEGTDDTGPVTFDYNQLMRSCVHGAAAMLKDKDSVNSTARVHKLLALLQNCMPGTDDGAEGSDDDGKTFRDILKRRIYLLLKDKEDNKMMGTMALDWLSNDVASVDAVNKAGTFRRSLWQYLELKITPILAGIIAFVDTNNNMSLIGHPGLEAWNQRMWLSLFSRPTLTQLGYEDLVSAKRGTELQEMVVQMRGAEGTSMSCQLPFSWLLKSQIDVLVNQQKKTDVGKEDVTRPVGRLLKQSPWWPILEAAFAEGGRDRVRDCYLEDYVRMVYKPQTATEANEYELVKSAIAATVLQLEEYHSQDEGDEELAEETGPLGAEHTLPLIHIAEAAVHSRLQLFSEIVMQNPEVIEQLCQYPQNNPDSPLDSGREMVLDVLAVDLVVERIQPTREMLRDKKSSHDWQHQVEMTSPLVNAILARANNLNVPGVGAYSKECLRVLKDIWCKWNRVTMVKMFVEIVCPEGSDQGKDITRHGPSLFKKLEDANFKTEKTMKDVEDFLRSITRLAYKQCTGEVKQCPGCTDPMVTSVVMPCGHEVCEQCLMTLQEADDFSCYACKDTYPPDTELERREGKGDQIRKLQTFKQRCNSFLTELVSRMCFAGTTPPEAGVVTMLMGYITGQRVADQNRQLRPRVRTKEMNLFNDKLDPTPVVRSVLLQLLLRSNIDEVHEHLVNYFNQAQDVVIESKDMVELAVLYIQCLEDHYFTASSATPGDKTTITQAFRRLEQSDQDLQEGEDQVTQLEGIAKARFGLSIAADWLINAYVKRLPNVPGAVQWLFRAARVVCSHEDKPGPGVYLMRQIVRRYSFNELQQVANIFPWIIPEYAQQNENENLPDQFVVWGAGYRNIRDVLSQTMVNDEMEPLTNALSQRGGDANQQLQHTLLAIFREITLLEIHRDERKRPSPEMILRLQATCQASPTLRSHNDLAQALLINNVAKECSQLKVSPDLTNRQLMMLEVVVHFMVSITTTNTHNLLNPLASLVTNPAAMANSFLPTMPEDERTEIHEALLAARGIAGNDPNPSMYECPNGHLYIIGNCGRPAVVHYCHQCGAQIGGVNYRLSDRNRKADIADMTRPGHCLGPAANRSRIPAPERTMSPACTALVRFLVHLGLYAGANTQLQAVHALLYPDVRQAAVPDFLWEHMMCDLEVLSRAVGKGMDDTLILVHLLIRDLAVAQNKGNMLAPHLGSKQARRNWETQFSAVFVTPLLNELDERLNRANLEILGDVRQDNNVLRRLIHETDAQPNAVDATTDLDEVPAMWRFRTRVSIGHLTQALSENIASHPQGNQQALQKRHQILHLFLEKEALLRAVRYIPRILQLLKAVSQVYHRKIDRSEADALKVKDFLRSIRDDVLRDRCKVLFNDFGTAWTTVHTYLQTHGVAGQVLPPEYCNQTIGDETPISTFLPSVRGRGLCSIALLHYLTTVHNNFMADYCRISKKQHRPEVSFHDLTQAHLIFYDPDRDLLPMVLANCTYSLEVGHGTKIEYNFRSLEQQLQERFIKGKAMLAFQLEPISFREDLNNAVLFRSLEKKIPQESFSPAMQNQIRGDAHYMVEVSDCLSHLDIAIGFLVSVGGEPQTLLHQFMVNTLRMDAGTLTPRARQHCKLCHTQALWLLFSHEREKMAVKYNQEPFTSVDSRGYGVELAEEQVVALERVLPHMNVDSFLNELHECMVMHITIKADPNDEDYVDNKQHGLAEVLYVYIDNKDGTNIPALTNGSFPADIKVEQCVETWRVACRFLQGTI